MNERAATRQTIAGIAADWGSIAAGSAANGRGCRAAARFDRIVTQGQPGCTIESFEELKKLAQDGKIRVIVPEVVVLEFEKFCRELDNTSRLESNRFKKDVAEVWQRNETVE